MRVTQYLPDLVPHDAISDHARRLRDVLTGAGHEVSIEADHLDRRLRAEARRWDPESAPPGVALYHASTGSPMARWLGEHAARGTRLVVDYHNITPARYFERWEPSAAARCRQGRAELALLASWAELALADSQFNEAELQVAGFARTATCPLLVDLGAFERGSDPVTAERLASRRARDGSSWLFVGRLAPNKCQHDVVAAFALFRQLHDPAATLTLVGSPSSTRYRLALERLCATVGVAGSVEILAGVPHDQLLAHFRAADVFVCLSEHEGFCVPLVEAMVVGTPVVARATSAVPETLGDAGVLVDGADSLEVAESVAALLADSDRRHRLVAAGRRRAGQLALQVTAHKWVSAFEKLS